MEFGKWWEIIFLFFPSTGIRWEIDFTAGFIVHYSLLVFFCN